MLQSNEDISRELEYGAIWIFIEIKFLHFEQEQAFEMDQGSHSLVNSTNISIFNIKLENTLITKHYRPL